MKNRKKIAIIATIVAMLTLIFTVNVAAEEYLLAYANVDTTLNIREEQREDSKQKEPRSIISRFSRRRKREPDRMSRSESSLRNGFPSIRRGSSSRL